MDAARLGQSERLAHGVRTVAVFTSARLRQLLHHWENVRRRTDHELRSPAGSVRPAVCAARVHGSLQQRGHDSDSAHRVGDGTGQDTGSGAAAVSDGKISSVTNAANKYQQE